MGCDIHAMIEKKFSYGDEDLEKHGFYVNAGNPCIMRNYVTFSILAGVRNYYDLNPISDPRGMIVYPDVIPEKAKVDTSLGEGVRYREVHCSEYTGWARNWGVDGHSHSWVTLEEMKSYDIESVKKRLEKADADRGGVFVVWDNLIAVMEHYGTGVPDKWVRLAFFFDN